MTRWKCSRLDANADTMRDLEDPTSSARHTSRTPLLDLLKQRYDLEELRTLCFDVGVNFDDLRGEGRSGKARELILQLQRTGRLGELISRVCTEHPEVNEAELNEFSDEVATIAHSTKGWAHSSASDGSLGRVTAALIVPLILWLGVPITLLLWVASPRDTPRLTGAFGSLLRDNMWRSLLLVGLAIVWLAIGWVLLKRMRWKPRDLISWLVASQTWAEPFHVFVDHRDLMRHLLPRVKGTPVDDQDIPYIDRDCHDIMEAFRPGARILISGRTKCGKTREVIHLIEAHSYLGLTILVPKPGSALDINPDALNALPTRGLLLLLDDLHRFFPDHRDQIMHCVQTLAQHCDSPSELIVVATARDEKEYQDRLQFDATTTRWRGWRHFRLQDVTADEAATFIQQVAELTGIKITEDLVRVLAGRNDGTFLNLMLTFRYWARQLITTVGEADLADFRTTLAETWKHKWNELVRQDRYVASIGSAIRFLYDQELPVLEGVVVHVAFLQHLSSLGVVALFGPDFLWSWLRFRLTDLLHPWQGKGRAWLTPLIFIPFIFFVALLSVMYFVRRVALELTAKLPTKLWRALESVRAETPHLDDLLVPYEAQTEIYQLNQDGLLVQSTGTILRPSHGFIRQIFAQEIMIDSVAWWYTRRDFLDAAAHIALQAFRLAPRNEIVAWRTARILKATGDLDA